MGFPVKDRAQQVPSTDVVFEVYPSEPITNPGIVTQWNFWPNAAQPFKFVVVRLVTGTTYEIVGINDIVAGDITTGQANTKIVPPCEQFQVQAGDIIGISTDNPGPELDYDSTSAEALGNGARWVIGMDPNGLVVGGTVTTDMTGPRAWSLSAEITDFSEASSAASTMAGKEWRGERAQILHCITKDCAHILVLSERMHA